MDEIGLSWLERFRNFLPGQFRRQEYQVVLQDLGEQREVSAPDPLEVEPDSQDSVGHHTPGQGGSQGGGAQGFKEVHKVEGSKDSRRLVEEFKLEITHLTPVVQGASKRSSNGEVHHNLLQT